MIRVLPSTTPTPTPTPAPGTAAGTPGPACGCPEGTAAARALSRRSLLRAGLAGVAATATAWTVGDVTAQVSHAAPGWTGETLVVLSLRGGFDGLSAVVPHGDPDYYAARPGIAVPRASLLAGDEMFGLHPAMAPLLPLWRAGTFGAVHAVGQGSPTRSHFAAMEEMERAAPGTSVRTGWIDRTLGVTGTGSVLNGVQLGVQSPRSFAGPRAEVTVQSLEGFALIGPREDRPVWHEALRRMHDGAPAAVAEPALTLVRAMEDVAAVRARAAGPANGARYPEGALGSALAQTASLIRSAAPVQVVALDSGDWDMHAGLGGVDGGWMARKLGELSSALAAFATDLGDLLSRVTVLTLSEFGRRVEENASGGVDHGHGNAVLLLGGGVVGGRVHGRWPGLAPAARVDGDLAATTDYRSLVGEVLQKRCGAGSLSEVFPGARPEPLGVVRAR